MEYLALLAVACIGIGYEIGVRDERTRILRRHRPSAVDAPPHRHLSGKGTAADGADELPDDGDCAAPAAGIPQTRREG